MSEGILGKYYLSPWMRNPSRNPGEAIEIELYITGVGNIPTDIKMNVSNPASILKVDKEGHVGYAQTCIIIGKDRKNNIVNIATGNNKLKDSSTGEIMPAVQKFPQSKTGSTFSLKCLEMNFVTFSTLLGFLSIFRRLTALSSILFSSSTSLTPSASLRSRNSFSKVSLST